ncbi:coiled-coil domain-containing protein 80 [Trichomycterus rosablanca]|uniref:coiled-coil domain-containing protein 80 n=1 Tax=Trichomycterus rosablanca TaxID=2290929 RepID=UPI002F350BD1
MTRLWIVLVGLVLWSCSTALSARTGKNRQRPKVRDEPAGQTEHVRAHGGGEREAGRGSETDFLADFAGKKRLWVIAAPSHADDYLRMMEKQIEESEGLNCRLADRDTLIVTIIQNAMMEGKIKYTTRQGQATEQSLDSDMVTKLLHYLELEHQMFSMLILKKNLKVGERFPYPVRVEAVLEVIDQLPVRKLEKVARKGSIQKCKITKKRLIAKPNLNGAKMKRVFSPQSRGNLTSVFKTQREPLDKKAAIRNKVQDILNGRSRFVIRKNPSSSSTSGETTAIKNAAGTENVKIKSESPGSKHVEKKTHEATDTKPEQTVDQSKSKKKGKGKKNRDKKKKGKREGKSHRDADASEKSALKEFMEKLRGKRRLLVISSSSDMSGQYIQQRDENELHSCDLALRKVTVLSILGLERNPTLRLQHYQQDGDPRLASLPDSVKNPDLIAQIRTEYGLANKEFSMMVTDYDLIPDVRKVFQSPTDPQTIVKYIDSFESRQAEKEREKETSVNCGPSEMDSESENSLLRFMSKRRLLIVSAPAEDDYSLHQQLQALNGQECHMGIRHFASLKLVGRGAEASGTVELFPLNGRSQSEKETLSHDVVRNLRDQLKINTDYFSMLVVGKDGDVKAWFPSPVWSLANIYDLVDSMELRQQEERLQRTLGIYCPEDGAGAGGGTYHGGGGYHGYGDETEDGYLYRRPEE